MENDNDFTYDDKRFAGLPQFVDHLHQIGMKYITMFDCGISSGETPGTYSPYDEGLALDIFIKNSSGKPFEGNISLIFFCSF
jgi:lysosomal alpha-glucosidase